MDPGFVVCHDFARLGDANQASKVAEFLAPNTAVAELLARAFVEGVKKASSGDDVEPLPYPSENIVIGRLQRKLDAFETVYCGQ